MISCLSPRVHCAAKTLNSEECVLKYICPLILLYNWIRWVEMDQHYTHRCKCENWHQKQVDVHRNFVQHQCYFLPGILLAFVFLVVILFYPGFFLLQSIISNGSDFIAFSYSFFHVFVHFFRRFSATVNAGELWQTWDCYGLKPFWDFLFGGSKVDVDVNNGEKNRKCLQKKNGCQVCSWKI